MSHTNYHTCTSKFKVKDSNAFIAELHRLNVFPHGGEEVSQIQAGYFFDTKDQTFVISGSFDGSIGEIDPETVEFNDEPLAALIQQHLTGGVYEDETVSIITNYTEFRGGIVVNTGCIIVEFADLTLEVSEQGCHTDN